MDNDVDEPSCFPEPSVEDPTEGPNGESREAWLGRSTSDLAVKTREFYNRNLAALPLDIGRRLCREIHADRGLAKHFELVVGRCLQLLGASVEYEVPGAEGRRVDWLAQFDDGSVSVEATLPITNAVVGDTFKASQRIVDLAVQLAPRGYGVSVSLVPRIGQSDSLRPLRAVLTKAFAAVPPAASDAHWTLTEDLDPHGLLRIHLYGRSDPSAAAAWSSGPGVGFRDDTSIVIARAIDGKRDQVRGAAKPVLIALGTSGYGGHDVEQFDKALLGHPTWSQDTGGFQFELTGAFRPTPVGKEPTIAGALVFGAVASGGKDPILYLHPRFRGDLPAAIVTLRRRYAGDREVEEIPPARDGILEGLEWPRS
jgi:hypothetical protein